MSNEPGVYLLGTEYAEWERRLEACPAVKIVLIQDYGIPMYAAVDLADDTEFILCGTHKLEDTLQFINSNGLKVCMFPCGDHHTFISKSENWSKHVVN